MAIGIYYPNYLKETNKEDCHPEPVEGCVRGAAVILSPLKQNHAYLLILGV